MFGKSRKIINDDWRGNYKYFSEEEMRCKGVNCDCGGRGLPKHNFMVKLVKIRKKCGFALPCSSGFRCPSHNSSVSSTGVSGPHTTGLAGDFRLAGKKALMFVLVSWFYGMTGFGIKQKGAHGLRFIHIDMLSGTNRPWIWSY